MVYYTIELLIVSMILDLASPLELVMNSIETLILNFQLLKLLFLIFWSVLIDCYNSINNISHDNWRVQFAAT